MKIICWSLLLLLPALPLLAVSKGDSYDQVLAEKGKPNAKLERGNVKVLTYPDVVIRLEEGKVVSIKASGNDYVQYVKEPAPSDTTPAGKWTTNYAAACREAQATDHKIFLFFTGSDWCIWCQRLEGEVLSKPEFLGYARDHLVLVKLDFPQSLPQTDALKAQNQKLSQQFGIQGYPTVVVLDRAGRKVGELNYAEGGPGPFVAKLKKL